MQAMTSTDFRKNLSKVLDQVSDDCEPVIVVRNGKKATVVMSLDEYNALEATAYLLTPKENRARLLASIANAEAGKLLDKTHLFE